MSLPARRCRMILPARAPAQIVTYTQAAGAIWFLTRRIARVMAKVKSKRFHLVSLGCSKNTVDSESMAQLLGGAGYQATADPRQAEVLIVNTCGFIGPAKKESVDVLNELASHK